MSRNLIRLRSFYPMVFVIVVNLPLISSAQDAPTIEQVSAAFQIARQTGDAQQGKLSTDAVARALQFGPPNESEEDGQNPLIFRSVVVDINQTIPESGVSSFQRRLPGMLQDISTQWTWEAVNPLDAYQAFRVCVNPPGRPDQLFLYPVNAYTEFAFPAVIDDQSAAQELVKWASRAHKLEELKSSFDEQQLDALAEGCFILLLIAIEQDDSAEVRVRCQQLARFVQRATSIDLIRLLAATLLQSNSEILRLEEVQELLQSISSTLLSVDPQTEGAASYAVTVAIRTWQLRLQAIRSAAGALQLPDVLNSGEQLLARQTSLPSRLSAKLLAGMADAILMFDFADQVPDGFLHRAIKERQGRFPVNRQLPRSADDVDLLAAVPKEIRIHWDPDPELQTDAFWCQAMDLRAKIQPASLEVLFAVSGLESIGHPTVNYDGSIVAFHGRRPGTAPGSGAHVFVVDRKQQTINDIGLGVSPSLSPTGERLTCSRYTPNKGVWLVRRDGTNWELIDERGWASRFSPDGSSIAYSLPQQKRQTFDPTKMGGGFRSEFRVGRFSGNRPREREDIPFNLRTTEFRAVDDHDFLQHLYPIRLVKPGVAVFCFEDVTYGWVCEPNSAILERVAFGRPDQDYGKKLLETIPRKVIGDLHAVGPSEFVWLGNRTGTGNVKDIYWSGRKGALSLGTRSALGVTVIDSDRIVVLSQKGAP